jgi:hypothetical protein
VLFYHDPAALALSPHPLHCGSGRADEDENTDVIRSGTVKEPKI